MEKHEYMVCNICKQQVKARKISGFGNPFPEKHDRPDGKQVCHGYFKTGHYVKDGV